jgi:hypothetical protein
MPWVEHESEGALSGQLIAIRRTLEKQNANRCPCLRMLWLSAAKIEQRRVVALPE